MPLTTSTQLKRMLDVEYDMEFIMDAWNRAVCVFLSPMYGNQWVFVILLGYPISVPLSHDWGTLSLMGPSPFLTVEAERLAFGVT